MNRCESNAERLSALADGELGGFAAWRLRRHVAGCADCAKELADWQRMTGVLRGVDVVVRPGSTPLFERPERRVRPRSAFLIPGIAVAAMAAVVGLVVFAPGQPGNPKIVYAEVTQAMAQIKTAHWSETMLMYNRQSGVKESEIRSESYVRMNPLASIRITHFHSKPGATLFAADYEARSVMTPMGEKRYDSGGGGVTTIMTSDKTSLRDRILRQLSADFLVERYRSAGALASNTITSQHVLLGAVHAVRFSILTLNLSNGRYASDYEVWADASTKRILREESTLIDRNSRKPIMTMIREGFHYDEPISDTTFALGAPAGAPTHILDFRMTPVRKEIQAESASLIAKTYKAYEHGDWKAFSAGWDFRYAATLPHSSVAPGQQEAALHAMVDAARGKYQVYDGKPNGASWATYTKIMGYPDTKLPMPGPRLLSVGTTARILYRDNFDCGGPERFYIRVDGPGAPKIVGWSSMTPEVREANHRRWIKNGRHW